MRPAQIMTEERFVGARALWSAGTGSRFGCTVMVARGMWKFMALCFGNRAAKVASCRRSPESRGRTGASWSAAVLCRISIAGWCQSGRGLPQSKTWRMFVLLAILTTSAVLGQTEAELFAAVQRDKDAAAALKLAQRGAPAVPFLVQGLERGGRTAALCAWALAQRPQRGTEAALRQRLLKVDQVAGYFAARALGKMPSDENVNTLASLLATETNGYWELSAGGVGRLRDAWNDQGQRYNEPAPTNMANLRVAYAAVEALGEIGGDTAAATLLRALESDQYLIRYGAARGLARAFGGRQSSRLRGAPERRFGAAAAGALEGRAPALSVADSRSESGRGLPQSKALRADTILARLAMLAEKDPVLIVRRAAEQALMCVRDPNIAFDILGSSPAGRATLSSARRATHLSTETNVDSERRAEDSAALPASSSAPLPPSIAFIKTKHRSDATFGFRDSYFFPKTPRYHSGDNLYTLTPPKPDGTLKNLTQLTNGEVQGVEVSFDGTKLLFAMRRDRTRDGFHIFEMNIDGSGLRQLTDGNCNDVDPCYLPDGRVAFDSDRCGWQEYYHQERSRVIYVMNGDGTGVQQITFNPNEDYDPIALRDGRLMYSSYRFYAQDGSEGPLPGEFMGLARIETVLRTCNPDGSADNLFYGSMRGPFYVPMRPMPFSDQFAGWHGRGYHVGVSVSLQREMPDGKIICTTPAGLTLIDPARAPLDCEMPIYPEVVNLAGGEEVYIHNYDEMNPIGRYTAPYPMGGDWILVSHAPWHDLRVNGYGLYAMNLVTRELRLIYDDPQMADVDAVPVAAQSLPMARESTLAKGARLWSKTQPQRPGSREGAGTNTNAAAGAAHTAALQGGATGLVLCNSVFNTDQPFDTNAVRYVRVLEGVQMGQSIAANAAFRTRILGTAPVQRDGSFFVEVPADVPIRFELLDEDQRMLVHETEFMFVRPGETKGCVGCHESRKEATPNAHPLALRHPPFKAARQRGDLIYMGQRARPYNAVYRD